MLYTQKLQAELERKRDQFANYQEHYGQQLETYRAALRSLSLRYPSSHTIEEKQRQLLIAPTAPASFGAFPTAEYDAWQRIRGNANQFPLFRFPTAFAHHGEARSWAERLRGVTTLAVDGSQLLPWRDASVPIALVQASYYENPHLPPAPYVKDVVTEILAPEELLGAEPDQADARTGEILNYSGQVVNLRRFELEVRTLITRMEHHAHLRDSRSSGSQESRASIVAFYDGSLIVSFALKMPPQYRTRYVQASKSLLDASERLAIPVISYIDTSYARDIVTMLGVLAEDGDVPETRGVHDALLWRGALNWGDRTPAFISARDDLERMGYDEHSNDVAFVYFQAALDRPPARLEFPRWLLDANILDDVLDTVRAETIAGNGYPYPIEAADAVAVISNTDRAQFYALFQDFADREGLAFTFSRKALSKNRRRV